MLWFRLFQDSTGCRKLITILVILSISGCALSKPPFINDMSVLSPDKFSSQNPPEVRVRYANAEEANIIPDFPGKKDWELSAQIDSAGSLLFAPVFFIFFFPEVLNPNNWHFRQDPKLKEALEQFPSHLTKGIEQRFQVSPLGGSRDLLEVVYVADVLTIGPGADTVCFVVHAQITLQSEGSVLYREIIRIDPRAFSNDFKRPDCTKSPDRILNCADETLPVMIQARLPGLPWKPSP
jgi:hypothetical protein